MSRIGVWNTAFLGDAVLTLPLLRTLRANYPDAELHFWVRRGVGSLFAAQPELSGVHEFDKRGGESGVMAAARVGRQLARERHSLWISAHTSLRSACIARWTSAKVRIGYDAPWFNSWFYTHTVPRRFDELDEIERLLQLVRPLNLPQVLDWPELVLPEPARERAAAFRAAHAAPGAPLLGVHPGSVWATKRWPAEYFAEVVRRAAAHGARIVLFAGPGEEAVAREVAERSGTLGTPALIDLSGALSLVDLAAHLGILDCYLSNDSGPMHIAWAQRTPVTAIFGPTVRRHGFYPRGPRATVLETGLDCRPCGLHGPQQCPLGHHRCMRDITPDTVWQDVHAKLFG